MPKTKCLFIFGANSHVMSGFTPSKQYSLIINASRKQPSALKGRKCNKTTFLEYNLNENFTISSQLDCLIRTFSEVDIIFAAFDPSSISQDSGGLSQNLARPIQTFRSLSNNFPECMINAVFISSMYACIAPNPFNYTADSTPNPLFYGVAKAGIDQALRWLSVQNPIHTFNSIALGPMPKESVFRESPELIRRLQSSVPSGRLVKKSDLHLTINYLLSVSVSALRGVTINLDNGYTVW